MIIIVIPLVIKMIKVEKMENSFLIRNKLRRQPNDKTNNKSLSDVVAREIRMLIKGF